MSSTTVLRPGIMPPPPYPGAGVPQVGSAVSVTTPMPLVPPANTVPTPVTVLPGANNIVPTHQAFRSLPPVQTVAPTAPVTASVPPTVNPSKTLFLNNKAVIYALNVRTFTSQDRNGDGKISWSLGESGTFVGAIQRLDELKRLGVNVIHVLPITTPGQMTYLGNAGSVYAAADLHKLNPQFAPPGHNVNEDAKRFVEEAHKRGIYVMVDIPSCGAKEFTKTHPELLAKDRNGKFLVPASWVDIMMFKNGPELQNYYEGFFDLMANQLGVDGFRADVARARTLDFWQHFAKEKYPDKAWLAETYTEEPFTIRNIPRDCPQELMKAGFDSIYGQFHIFHQLPNADAYMKYLTDSYPLLRQAGTGKSFIGSFYTHDDHSLMTVTGPIQYMLNAGLMAAQPWTNPYIMDGYTTGDETDVDIFNYTFQAKGNHPEIGQVLKKILDVRQQTGTPQAPGVGDLLTKGWFVPLKTEDPSRQIIAFARHLNGKTVLVVANKDINARHQGTIQVPGLNDPNPVKDLAPAYGQPSVIQPKNNGLKVDLGPGRFHLLEVNTPNLLNAGLKAYPGVLTDSLDKSNPVFARLNVVA
jgi:glycosidase